VTCDGLVPERGPAIDTRGTEAIQVEDLPAGFNKLVTRQGAHESSSARAGR
jgi:hypothetical protein